MAKKRRAFLVAFLMVVAAYYAVPPLSSELYGREVRAQQALLTVACSPEKPTAWPREIIRVRAWATSPAGEALQFTWTATGGRVGAQGPEMQWDFSGVQPGTYTATVRARDPRGGTADCAVRVVVLERRGIRGRETGWSFLQKGEKEKEGYGLYSYLLLGSRPNDATRERYIKAIDAYLRLIPDITSLEEAIPLRELNVAYVPITTSPPERGVSTEWVLNNYDYVRARALLRGLPGELRDGPYIVSFLKPHGASATPSRPYLYQDLSSVPPSLVELWLKEFLNQAAQERFWEGRTTAQLALKLRTTIGILAMGLPEVRKALDSWISLVR